MGDAWKTCAAVERVPGKVSGDYVFKGTRVPVRALFENLEGGATLDEFLEAFPGVERALATSVLSWSCLECQGWLLDVGDVVIKRRTEHQRLSTLERLIYCLSVADYGMTNAGDLNTAADLYPPFKQEAMECAAELRLPRVLAAFSLSNRELEARYFEFFVGLCTEIKEALGNE